MVAERGVLRRGLSRAYGHWINFAVVAIVCAIGVLLLLVTNAAPVAISLEAENGSVAAPASVITDKTASNGTAIAFGSASASSDANNLYRPIKISSPLQLPHAPRDANYVMWHFPADTTLQEAFDTLGPNDILVLPERAQPYEIDSSQGFVVDSTRWHEMARAKRGLVGLGPGVIVEPSASSFTLPRPTGTTENFNTVLKTVEDGAYLGNFEMRGRSFGQGVYDATSQEGNNAVWERIYFNGAHRGFMNGPPGETGAISGYHGNNQQVYNVEVDCRDPATGQRVGTSPLMFNAQSNVTLTDVYAHHALAGMPTFWRVTNITTNNLRSEYNGSASGTLAGAGINHELVSGTVIHNNPTLIIDRAHNPDGSHISIGTDSTNAQYYINNPKIDDGWDGPGILTVDIWRYPNGISQSDADIHVTGVPFRIHH